MRQVYYGIRFNFELLKAFVLSEFWNFLFFIFSNREAVALWFGSCFVDAHHQVWNSHLWLSICIVRRKKRLPDKLYWLQEYALLTFINHVYVCVSSVALLLIKSLLYQCEQNSDPKPLLSIQEILPTKLAVSLAPTNIKRWKRHYVASFYVFRCKLKLGKNDENEFSSFDRTLKLTLWTK